MINWLQKYWKAVAIALTVFLLSVISPLLPLKQAIKVVSDWVEHLGALGFLAYVGIYALGTVLFVPGSVLTIASGLFFGLGLGTLAAWLGAVLGATFAFLIARHLARRKIEEKIKGNQKFKAIDDAIGKQGWKIIGLLRLSPLIPFNASNYFYGVTGIKFWPYLLATGSGMLPGTLLYVYLGAAGKAGIDGSKTQQGTLEHVFFGIGLVATVAVTVVVAGIAKKALKEAGAAKEKKT
jgi:uncharacterized membrane protein YdjX (TVP38/TMEM64 family)